MPRRVFIGLAAIAALGCPGPDETDEGSADTGTTVSGGDTAATDSSASMDSSGGFPEVDYVTEIQPIWDENCVMGIADGACHMMGGSWPYNDLTPENSYENLMSADALESPQPFVEPGDPDGSYLWHKINMTWMGAPSNGSCCDMPLEDGPAGMLMDPGPLPQADLDKIEAWISNGAPE